MATATKKTKRQTNRSARIREAINRSPDASNNEVLKQLKRRRVKVSYALVAGVRKRMAANGNSHQAENDETIRVESLIEAKTFAARFRSIDEAKRYLSTLERLA